MLCPKCEREFDRLLALSRIDNQTMICDDCGTEEALDDLFGNPHTPSITQDEEAN